MPLPVRFASAEFWAHCHCDTAEVVFIYEGERNTSAECSQADLIWLLEFILLPVSICHSELPVCRQISTLSLVPKPQGTGHWHRKFPCALLHQKPSSRSGKHLVSATKTPKSDKGVSLHVMKSAWLVQHTAQTNNVQVSPAFEIREGNEMLSQ